MNYLKISGEAEVAIPAPKENQTNGEADFLT